MYRALPGTPIAPLLAVSGPLMPIRIRTNDSTVVSH
jgi:hypothetical protein